MTHSAHDTADELTIRAQGTGPRPAAQPVDTRNVVGQAGMHMARMPGASRGTRGHPHWTVICGALLLQLLLAVAALPGASNAATQDAGTWVATSRLVAGRQGHTATLLPNGQVLVAGGCCDAAGRAFASAELYDPRSGRWRAIGRMAVARSNHTATLLPNGRVLVAGGCCGSSYHVLASAELYDPRSGRWIASNYMNVARQNARAALLPRGRVLVIGGCCDRYGHALAGAELYR